MVLLERIELSTSPLPINIGVDFFFLIQLIGRAKNSPFTISL
jgi:hypothetical protein